MFCPNCGRSLDDSSMFCTYCGAKANTIAAAAPAPVSEPAPTVPEPVSAPAAPAPASTPVFTESTPVSAPAAPAPASSPVFAESAPVSAPANAPTAPEPVSAPFFAESAPVNAPVTAEQPPEKYYTFKHIALCLAAVALMAIVAGVFAGLYFSAIA